MAEKHEGTGLYTTFNEVFGIISDRSDEGER